MVITLLFIVGFIVIGAVVGFFSLAFYMGSIATRSYPKAINQRVSRSSNSGQAVNTHIKAVVN